MGDPQQSNTSAPHVPQPCATAGGARRPRRRRARTLAAGHRRRAGRRVAAQLRARERAHLAAARAAASRGVGCAAVRARGRRRRPAGRLGVLVRERRGRAPRRRLWTLPRAHPAARSSAALRRVRPCTASTAGAQGALLTRQARRTRHSPPTARPSHRQTAQQPADGCAHIRAHHRPPAATAGRTAVARALGAGARAPPRTAAAACRAGGPTAPRPRTPSGRTAPAARLPLPLPLPPRPRPRTPAARARRRARRRPPARARVRVKHAAATTLVLRVRRARCAQRWAPAASVRVPDCTTACLQPPLVCKPAQQLPSLHRHRAREGTSGV